MRAVLLLSAHLRANGYVLWDLLRSMFGNPEVIRPALLVYTRWSVEPPRGRRVARQVSVGYWKSPDKPGFQPTWTIDKVFFLEEYQQETQTWKRVIPKPRPPKYRTPWYLP